MGSKHVEKLLRILKIAGPHILILSVVAVYVVVGGIVFLHIETASVENPEAEALTLISGAFNESNITDEFMYTCSEADVEVLFDALFYGCCPASAQLKDECFIALKDELVQCLELIKKRSAGRLTIDNNSQSAVTKWDYTSAIVLAFTVVTTIGYGHIVPSTAGGRMFCVFYGLLGIPLTLLAIADHGRFLSTGMNFLHLKCKLFINKIRKPQENEEVQQEEDEDYEDEIVSPALLLIIYTLYLFIGSLLLVEWEEGWTFSNAMYFSFISLSTIGFGDIVPSNYKYIPYVLLYIGIGLVLSSVAIEILAEYLRQLHQFGMKIRNVQVQKIWFGGKALTVKELVASVGKHLGADEATLAQLVENLDIVVNQCIEEKETGIAPEVPLVLSYRHEKTDHFEENEITKEPLTPKPETPKPETPKPETPKPETPKPEPQKPSFFSEVDFIDDRDDE